MEYGVWTYNIESVKAEQESTHTLWRHLGDPGLARRHQNTTAEADDDLAEQEHAAPGLCIAR